MTLTETYRQALTQISELPTDSKTWQEYAAKNKPLDWINVNKAIRLANEALDSKGEPSREHVALIQLRNHFNSANVYPAQEKIEVANMIIDCALDKDKVDYSKQLRLEF